MGTFNTTTFSSSFSAHGKPDSSPEAPESPNDKDSPEPPGALENRELKSPRQDPYHTNMEPPPSVNSNIHELPPMSYNNDDGRMMQQPFAFPTLLMTQQMESEIVPTDLRVMAKPNSCPCGTSVQDMNEPQNLAYRPQSRDKEPSDSDTDTEIDLTSHSKDDDIRESERLASRIATSIFRSDTVLHDMMPNDLSLGAKNGNDRVRNNVSI